MAVPEWMARCRWKWQPPYTTTTSLSWRGSYHFSFTVLMRKRTEEVRATSVTAAAVASSSRLCTTGIDEEGEEEEEGEASGTARAALTPPLAESESAGGSFLFVFCRFPAVGICDCRVGRWSGGTGGSFRRSRSDADVARSHVSVEVTERQPAVSHAE